MSRNWRFVVEAAGWIGWPMTTLQDLYHQGLPQCRLRLDVETVIAPQEKKRQHKQTVWDIGGSCFWKMEVTDARE